MCGFVTEIKAMKVLMFGWEFPPFNTGGLGTACYGLTNGLSRNNVDITFVLPYVTDDTKSVHVNLIAANSISKVRIRGIKTKLAGYMTPGQYKRSVLSENLSKRHREIYGENLFSEVCRYALKAGSIAKEELHDVIHCHDWMTYAAGKIAKSVSGKPLVLHVHATEFDRTGGNVNQAVYDLEREGMHAADAIIAVSNYTRKKVIEHYGVSPEKVFVVHNAVDNDSVIESYGSHSIRSSHKVVLFLGRVTLQKGPDYFLLAAKRVLDYEPDARFVVAGSGDMAADMVEKAAELGIGDKVLFTGFLTGKDIERAHQMADVYIMPSVSEPFELTALEAMKNKTPIIISNQSGVSEVIGNCLKTDFWDTERMAGLIIGVIRYREAQESLSEN